MPAPDTLLLFAAASLALYLIPGPDMLVIASRSIAGGVRTGAATAFGVFAGLLAHMAAAAFGLAAVLAVQPLAFAAVEWVGAAYLAYLGLRLLVGSQDLRAFDASGGAATPGRAFRQGLFVNLLNPKIALFFMAFLPQFVDPTATGAFADPGAQILLLGALFNAGSLVWVLLQAVVFARIGGWLRRRPAVLRWQQRASGAALIGLAGRLALSER